LILDVTVVAAADGTIDHQEKSVVRQTETKKIAESSKTDLVLTTNEEKKGNEPEATEKGTTGVEVV